MQTIGAIGVVLIWTGALSGFWNNAGNWNPSTVPPSTAVALEFPASAARKQVTNDLDLSAAPPLELRFTASGFAIYGNGIPTCGIDATHTAGVTYFSAPLLAHGACTELELRSVADGSIYVGSAPGVPITKLGTGIVYLLGSGTSEDVTIEAGGLVIQDDRPNSDIVIAGGALAGDGSVGDISSNSGALRPGGTVYFTLRGRRLTPGTGVGHLTSTRLDLSASTTLFLEIEGTDPSEYDRFTVNGVVELNGATLTPTISGFTPALGTTFTIITNDGSDPVVGTFVGLAEGATLSIGAHTARVSYVGGTGNDVTLEIQAASPDPLTIMPATLGQMTVGVSFSESFTASGGIAPYTFAVTGGTLPAGLSLSAAGLLSGTPTEPGAYSFTVTATDSVGDLTFGMAAMFASAATTYSGTVASAVPAMPAFAITLLAVLLFVVARRGLA